jgi:putative hemolysin
MQTTDAQGRAMISDDRHFDLRLAKTDRDVQAAQRLRYLVFVEELGGDGPGVDHAARRESDGFDPFCDHLLLIDQRRNAAALEDVIGVYRLLPGSRVGSGAGQAPTFYCDQEYDLTPLRVSGRSLLELGRSCVHPDYRGGTAVHLLWVGLGAYVKEQAIDILFGVASFHGTDVAALAEPLSWLHHNHLAPPELRVTARAAHRADMGIIPPDQIDRRAAMHAMPALIKGYLRLGGFVGEGAFVDEAFNTTDVCLIMDRARVPERQRTLYGAEGYGAEGGPEA